LNTASSTSGATIRKPSRSASVMYAATAAITTSAGSTCSTPGAAPLPADARRLRATSASPHSSSPAPTSMGRPGKAAGPMFWPGYFRKTLDVDQDAMASASSAVPLNASLNFTAY
jgi:hypothetical protein